MSWAESDKTPVLGRMFSDEIGQKLGAPARHPDEPLEQRHRDIAASLQARLEEVYFGMLKKLAVKPARKRCVWQEALHSTASPTGKFSTRHRSNRCMFIQPQGDAGLAVGAAYHVWHQTLGKPRTFVMNHAYWGPSYSATELRNAIQSSAIPQGGFNLSELPDDELMRQTAAIIAEAKILGWYQGRAEWGPRALGNRSIVADPRRPEMKEILNSRIKHREIFRPFAPSILAEKTGMWFSKSHPSPFMTLAYSVLPDKRDKIPAPTHVDGTGRLQTVTADANPRYHALISEFERQTGVPVVLNTSFNDNEPIVCRPEEAIDCFLRTKMDALVLGNYLIKRS